MARKANLSGVSASSQAADDISRPLYLSRVKARPRDCCRYRKRAQQIRHGRRLLVDASSATMPEADATAELHLSHFASFAGHSYSGQGSGFSQYFEASMLPRRCFRSPRYAHTFHRAAMLLSKHVTAARASAPAARHSIFLATIAAYRALFSPFSADAGARRRCRLRCYSSRFHAR